MDKHFEGFDGVRKALDQQRSGQWQTWTLQRDDALPVQFSGTRIASSKVEKASKNGTEVAIYETTGGQIVTHVYGWQKNVGGLRKRHACGIHSTPQEALQWLIEDGKGRLGPASKKAWLSACNQHARFKGLGVEWID